MEEIVFWKEVDVKDATNSIKISDEVFGGIVFVKRVVVNILSDQEIMELKKNYVEKTFERGYGVSQKRLIGGEGL